MSNSFSTSNGNSTLFPSSMRSLSRHFTIRQMKKNPLLIVVLLIFLISFLYLVSTLIPPKHVPPTLSEKLKAASLHQQDTKTSHHYSFMNINVNDGYVQVEEPSYCLAVPVTPSGKIVLVKQRRRAANREGFEFPAGMIEDGKVYNCAKRELLEETGFTALHEHCIEDAVRNDNWAIHHDRKVRCSGRVKFLGQVFSEPSRNKQRGYGFLFNVAEDASQEVDLDDEERGYKQTRTVKLYPHEIRELIDRGDIYHAGHIAFFERAMVHLKSQKKRR